MMLMTQFDPFHRRCFENVTGKKKRSYKSLDLGVFLRSAPVVISWLSMTIGDPCTSLERDSTWFWSKGMMV